MSNKKNNWQTTTIWLVKNSIKTKSRWNDDIIKNCILELHHRFYKVASMNGISIDTFRIYLRYFMLRMNISTNSIKLTGKNISSKQLKTHQDAKHKSNS